MDSLRACLRSAANNGSRHVRNLVHTLGATALVIIGSNGVAAAQDARANDEHAGFVHAEEVGATTRSAVAEHGTDVGARANVQGQLWFGWTGDTSPAPENSVVIFPGSPFDARRGLIFSWQGNAIGAWDSTVGDAFFRWSTEESARFATDFMDLEMRAGHEAPIRFGDFTWRSVTNRNSVGGRLELPAFLETQLLSTSIRLMTEAADFDVIYGGDQYVGVNYAFAASPITFEQGDDYSLSRVRLLGADVYGSETADSDGLPERGTHVIHFDAVSWASTHSSGWSLDGAIGLSVLRPSSAFTAANADQAATVLMPTAGMMFSQATSEEFYIPENSALYRAATPSRGTGYAFFAQTFQRTDPTGYAVDVGGRFGAESRLALTSDLFLSSELNFIIAHRVYVAPDAPLLSQDVGAWLPMVQLQANLDWHVAANLAVRTTAYAEYSDRDDPQMFTNARADGLGSVVGVRLSLRYFGDTMRRRPN